MVCDGLHKFREFGFLMCFLIFFILDWFFFSFFLFWFRTFTLTFILEKQNKTQTNKQKNKNKKSLLCKPVIIFLGGQVVTGKTEKITSVITKPWRQTWLYSRNATFLNGDLSIWSSFCSRTPCHKVSMTAMMFWSVNNIVLHFELCHTNKVYNYVAFVEGNLASSWSTVALTEPNVILHGFKRRHLPN